MKSLLNSRWARERKRPGLTVPTPGGPDPFILTDEQKREKRRNNLLIFLGALTLLIVWWWFSGTTLDYVFPGPRSTAEALGRLLSDSSFWFALGLTIRRALIGFILAVLVGVLWGAACGISDTVNYFTTSWLHLLMSIPPIVLVILAMLWFGTSDTTVITVVIFVTSPLLVTSTAQAVRDMDLDLIEMAKVFGFSRWRIIAHVLAPMLAPPILAAATVALGQSIRVAVMGELLATSSGIGAGIRLAQINIETADVFAYALVMASVTFALDYTLVKPMRRHFMIHTMRKR